MCRPRRHGRYGLPSRTPSRAASPGSRRRSDERPPRRPRHSGRTCPVVRHSTCLAPSTKCPRAHSAPRSTRANRNLPDSQQILRIAATRAWRAHRLRGWRWLTRRAIRSATFSTGKSRAPRLDLPTRAFRQCASSGRRFPTPKPCPAIKAQLLLVDSQCARGGCVAPRGREPDGRESRSPPHWSEDQSAQPWPCS